MQRFRNVVSRAFNTSILQDKRFGWVDYIRGIAILLVVYRHALLGIERTKIIVPHFLNDANMIFYSFRMPLFFILSGIFISRSLAKRSTRSLLGIKFEKLLYPYLVWTFLQVTLQIALSDITNSKRTLLDYTYILYQPRHLDQFWYLSALFNTTLIYVLLKTQLNFKPWMQIILGLIFYSVFPYFQSISMLSDWMEFYLFFAIGDWISAFFFKNATQLFLKNKLIILFIVPLFILSQLFYLRYIISHNYDTDNTHTLSFAFLNNISYQGWFLLIALIGCLSMFVLAFQLQQHKILSFLRVLGYHSLYIYVMHVIITAFVRILLMKFFGITNIYLLLFLTIIAGVTIPIIIYNLLIRKNIGWFLFSFHKPRRTKHTISDDVKTEVAL